MPCTSPTPPPGLFDLLVPHTLAISFAEGVLLPGMILILLVIETRSLARRLPPITPGREREILRWNMGLSRGLLLLGALLLSLAGFWSAALDAWLSSPGCIVMNVSPAYFSTVSQMEDQAHQLGGVAASLSALGFCVLWLCERKMRRLAPLTRG
jgi:hypothetical protein